MNSCDDVANAMNVAAQAVSTPFEVSLEAALGSQETPLACKAINRFLAMTMLANAKG